MSKHSIKSFDPERVAMLDTQMLRAYYSHKFPRLFRLLTKLFKEQVGVNSVTATRLAYYSARAAVTFRRTGNVKRTEAFLVKYYRLVNRFAIEDVDAVKCAKTELNYWLVHRYPKRYKQPLPQALSEAKATLYRASPESLEAFGRHYVAATNIRDKATHIDHVKPDWEAIEEHLRLAYISLHQAVN